MLQDSREAILRKIEPVSIHGQVSWDLYVSDPDDPDGPVGRARVGPEAVEDDLEPGDRIRLEILLGNVTRVTRVER